jgi:hypothetical protein
MKSMQELYQAHLEVIATANYAERRDKELSECRHAFIDVKNESLETGLNQMIHTIVVMKKNGEY